MSIIYPPQKFVTSNAETCDFSIEEIQRDSRRFYIMHDIRVPGWALSDTSPSNPGYEDHLDEIRYRDADEYVPIEDATFRGDGLADAQTRREAAKWLHDIVVAKDGCLPVDVNLYQQLPQDGSFEAVGFGWNSEEDKRVSMSRADVEAEVQSDLHAPQETAWMRMEQQDKEKAARWEKYHAQSPEERAQEEQALWEEIERVHRESHSSAQALPLPEDTQKPKF
jgi:hypothetical protein